MNIYLKFKLLILAIINITRRYLLYPAFIFLIIYFLPIRCLSQVTQEWVRRYPDSNTFIAGALALALDDSSNVYITGNTHTTYWSAYCTIKYKPDGTQQWIANYYGDNSGGRYAYAIALDRSSNVFVTGYSYRSGSYFDYCTIKYNSNGVQQWVQYYDGPAHDIDQAQKIAVDNTGNVYVTGFSAMLSNGFQCTTIKYSTDGRELWVQRYGHVDISSKVNGIVLDDSCNVYITGGNYYSAATIKYDSSGRQIWSQLYSGPIGEGTVANDIAMDRDRNVFITGTSYCANERYADMFTIKYSNSGVQQWLRRYYFQDTVYDNNVATSIGIDSTGNIYSGGYSGVSQGGYYQLCAIKYSNNGDLIWAKKDTSKLGAMTATMCIDSRGSVYITGSWGNLPNYNSYITIKYDSAGSEQWKQIYNFEYGDSYPYDIIIDKNFDILITGMGTNSNYYGHYDMITIKYSQPIGIKRNFSNAPESIKLYQNYPNPFNPITKIKFDVPIVGNERQPFIHLAIYDILGHEISILVNRQLKPGSYEVDWDGSNYSSGIYFYKINIGNFSDTKKMILLK